MLSFYFSFKKLKKRNVKLTKINYHYLPIILLKSHKNHLLFSLLFGNLLDFALLIDKKSNIFNFNIFKLSFQYFQFQYFQTFVPIHFQLFCIPLQTKFYSINFVYVYYWNGYHFVDSGELILNMQLFFQTYILFCK